MGVVKGQGHIAGEVSNWFASFSLHINQNNISWDTVISKFEPSKVKVIDEVKGSGHIVFSSSSLSIQLTHILFVSCQSDQPFLRFGQ